MTGHGLASDSLLSLVRLRLWPDSGQQANAIWIQAVSLGEVEVARGLVETLGRIRAGEPILVTSTTPAGVSLLSRALGALPEVRTRPFPLDLPFSVRRFFDTTRPELLVLVETEIWPMVLLEAQRRRVPVLLVNARLSERSVRRFRAARVLLSRPLGAVTRVLARTEADAARFAEIGIDKDRIQFSGDMKFDRREPEKPLFEAAFRRLATGRPVVVAGSVADEEVDILIQGRRELVSLGIDPFIVVAPRRPDSFSAIGRQIEGSGSSVAWRSRLSQEGEWERPADFLLLDSVGELAGTYALGNVALLGGTFGTRGGHNILEPLRSGLPTLVGPSTKNIRETIEAAGPSVFPVSGAIEIAATIARLLRDPELRGRAARSAHELFQKHSGATERAARAALSLLDERRAERCDAGALPPEPALR